MLKKLLGAPALTLAFSFNGYAAEQPLSAEEAVSTEIITQRRNIAQKREAVKDINNQIRHRNDAELREYIRNSNDLNKMIDPNAKIENIDVKDKNAVSKFMQKEVGLEEKIVKTEPVEIKTNRKYQSRASQVLK